jgi:hypothetical protein
MTTLDADSDSELEGVDSAERKSTLRVMPGDHSWIQKWGVYSATKTTMILYEADG